MDGSANGGRAASPVGACEGVVLAAALLPLAWPAVEQEVFLSSPEKILKAAFFPKRDAFGHLGCRAQTRRHWRQHILPLTSVLWGGREGEKGGRRRGVTAPAQT